LVPVWIGTSGWQYKDWRGRFYPPKLALARWLEYYAERFETVEVNNTFYRLPKPETFAAWRDRLPDGFVMTVKANRYITHLKQLHDPEEPVRRFLTAMEPLRERTGPILLQLPPSLSADHDRLAHALDQFPLDRLRVALEVRHRSWFAGDAKAETERVLRERNVALVLTDRKSRPLEPIMRTADWGYVRFHEGSASPHPHYSDDALDAWAERIAGCWSDGEDVYTYFNNDHHCWAIHDAMRFAERVRAHGLSPTRVPEPIEVHAG
jgi:uncharacterized protein YecE (DUF72 family)